MIAISSVVVVILVSLLITRVATVAFVLTGMSREAARFQARSALSGTGYTTSEAEGVVGHPVRRRIVMALMLVGSAGLVTVIATLMVSFTDAERDQALQRTLALIGGLTVVWLFARSAWVDRRLSAVIARLLRRFTELDARDYGALLHLADRFAVGELAIQEGDWLAEHPLEELGLRDEGVVVLGVTLKNGSWVGSPTSDVHLRAGDRIVAYGLGERLTELDRRRSGEEGNQAHRIAVEAHGEQIRALAGHRLD